MQRFFFATFLLAAAGAAARADGAQDKCEIHVTGDTKVDATVASPRAPHSVSPWLSAAIGYWNGGSDPGMFLVNCGNDQAHLTLGVAGKPTAKDVPFAPKKYAIQPDHDAKAGDFAVMFSAAPTGSRAFYRVAEPGTLDLTAFDASHIAGTFHFVAKSSKGGNVTVDGSFDYGCKGAACKP